MTAPLAPPAERGELTIGPTVVEKIAATAATEVEHVGGAARRVAGLALGSDAAAQQPRVSAQVAGDGVAVAVTCSVGYPAPVAKVTEALRRHIGHRIEELTGLHARSVDIAVAALTGDAAPHPKGRELS